MASPTQLLARSETFIEVYGDLLVQYEGEMDLLIQGGDKTKAQAAVLRTEINKVRALIGFWRGIASFWRNELNENKTALKDSNKLAQSS